MHDKRDSLILYLQKIKENNYKIKDYDNINEYLDLMLYYIGDKDPVLRDKLIYTTFYNWIVKIKYFEYDELLNILHIVLDKEHLFYNIGNKEDESVFVRSFSSLIVCLILNRHREDNFLDEKTLFYVKNSLITYYNEEKDLRGYVEGYGWAHSIAHGADGLYEITLLKECNEEMSIDILDSIKRKLLNGYYIFCHEEDERMICAVDTIFKRELISRERFEMWLIYLTKCLDEFSEYDGYVSKVNVKSFMRNLYFKSRLSQYDDEMVSAIFDLAVKL